MSIVLKVFVLLMGAALLLAVASRVSDGQVHAQQSPSLSASLSLANVYLELSNHSGSWWFNIDGGTCVRVGPGFYSGVLDYEPGAYGVKAYKSENGCDNAHSHSILGESTITFTNSSVRLDAYVYYGGYVYLVLVGHTGDWWYDIDDGDCMATTSRSHGPIHGYGQPSDWTMTIRAYSDGGCANQIDQTDLDMPATVLWSSVSDGKVALT